MKENESNEDIEEEKIRPKVIALNVLKVVIAVAITSILMQAVFICCIVPTGSMEDTIPTGSLLFGTRYDAENIERYDIMIFEKDGTKYIKRIIGLPGETIEIKNGEVYADGELLDSSFIKEEMDLVREGTYEVPEGCYFVLGDNRNNSYDSRYWDDPYVELEDFIGHARFILFPFNAISIL